MQHAPAENANPPFRHQHMFQMHFRYSDLLFVRRRVKIHGRLSQKCRQSPQQQNALLIQLPSPFIIRDQIGKPLQKRLHHIINLVLFCPRGKKILMIRHLMKIMEQFLKPPGKLLFLLRLKQQKHHIRDLTENVRERQFLCGSSGKEPVISADEHRQQKYTVPKDEEFLQKPGGTFRRHQR